MCPLLRLLRFLLVLLFLLLWWFRVCVFFCSQYSPLVCRSPLSMSAAAASASAAAAFLSAAAATCSDAGRVFPDPGHARFLCVMVCVCIG